MGDEGSSSSRHLFDFIFLNFILCRRIYWLWPEQCVKVRLIEGQRRRDTGQNTQLSPKEQNSLLLWGASHHGNASNSQWPGSAPLTPLWRVLFSNLKDFPKYWLQRTNETFPKFLHHFIRSVRVKCVLVGGSIPTLCSTCAESRDQNYFWICRFSN